MKNPISRPLAGQIARSVVAAVLVTLLSTALPAPAARATTITVDTTADENNSDGDCALREAIIAANEDRAVDDCPSGNGADTIVLPPGTYTLTHTGGSDDAALTGDLDITADLTIMGAGKNDTDIDGNGVDRVMSVLNATVRLSRLAKPFPRR